MSDVVNIVVWSKKGCSYCKEVKNYLNEKGFPFQISMFQRKKSFGIFYR